MARMNAGTGPVKRVDHSPPKRTSTPVTDAQSGGGYHIAPTPRPSFAGPLKPAFPTHVSQPARVPQLPARNTLLGRGAIYNQTPQQIALRSHHDAMVKRGQQVIGGAKRDVASSVGAGPIRVANPNDWYHPQPFQIGPTLRDSGPANNPSSIYRGPGRWNGAVMSPQNVQKAMAGVLKPGPVKRRLGDVAFLHQAGVVDPYGTTTHPEHVAQVKAYRNQLLSVLIAKQQAWQKATADTKLGPQDTALSPREIRFRLQGLPTSELERLTHWQPSGEQIQRAGVQTAGFGPGTIAGIIGLAGDVASKTGRAVGGLTGSKFVGNALGDVAAWPTWAVPALYSAATHPGQFAKGLASGVIGHSLAGDFAGAARVFEQHPLFSLAEVRGGQALLGRGVGAAVRQGSRGRFLGTGRDPINLTGIADSPAALLRSFNREPGTRFGQQIADRVMTKPGPNVRIAGRGSVPARVLRTDLPGVGRVLEQRRQHGVQRMVDYNRSQGISDEQTLRTRAANQAARARHDSPTGRVVANILGLPSRHTTAESYHGVLGKIVGKVAPKLATDPVADLVSFVHRGVIRSEVVQHDAHGAEIGRTHATAESVAQDLDHLISRLEETHQRPGAYRNTAEWVQGDQMLDFLRAVRGSGRGLARAVNIARRLAPEFAKNDAELQRLGALDPAAAQRAPLFPGAISRLDAKYQDGALRSDGGGHLSDEQIRTQLAAQGIDPSVIAHLPHNPLGRGAFHKQQTVESRRNADTHSLTGVRWERGASPYSWDHVVQSLTHGRTLAANIQTLDRFVHDVGTKVGDGSWKDTVRAAESQIRRDRNGRPILDKQGQPQPMYQAVRARGARLEQDRREQIAGLQDVAHDQPLSQTLLDERLRPPEQDGPDVAVLVPTEAVQRARAHIAKGSSVAEMQALSSAFRQTVLPFSTKWLTGNIAESILRVAQVTANPLDPIVARRAFDQMIVKDAIDTYGPAIAHKAKLLLDTNRVLHPRQIRAIRQDLLDYAPNARAAMAELTGGLFYGHAGQTVRRTSEDMGLVGKGVGQLGKLPVVAEFAGMTRWLGHKTFALNRMLERESQYAALGKHIRNEVQDFTGRWQSGVRLYGQALDDVSRGLLGTAAQVKAARWLDETLGQYSRFSPNTRQFIQTFAPFLPWYLNAVRFTMLTLPGKHPVKFALWTGAERAFQQDYTEQHKDARTNQGVQGDLATAIPHKGGYIAAARYTPFGFLGPVFGGDVSALASPLLPQFQGVQQALSGNDPFGRQMQIPDATGKLRNTTGGENAKIGAYQLAEGFLPMLQIARRLEEGGSTAYPDSTIFSPHTKPGSSHGQSAPDRIFNPFRPVYLHNSTASRGRRGKAVSPVDAALQAIGSGSSGGQANPDAVDQALKAIGG